MHLHRRHLSLRNGAVVISILVGAPLLAACGSSTSGGTSSSNAGGGLTVAVFNPFSGPDASFGSEQTAGCLPAVTAITAAGGILNHKSVACKGADSRGDPADAVPAANQLLATTSSLLGVLGPSSDEATATVPIFNRSQVPMFGDTGQAAFDKSTYGYFYRLTPPDDAVGYAMALYAHDKGYSTAATVFGNDISSQGTVPTVTAGFKKLGGSVVVNETLALDQSSYRSEVENIASRHPDVIFMEADPQTSATFIEELKQLYHLVPIVGTNATNQPPWIKAVTGAIGTAALNQYFVAAQPYAPTSGPGYAAWLSEFKAVQGKVSQPASQWEGNSYSMAAWDAVNLMALAAEEAKSTTASVYNHLIPTLVRPSPGAVVVHDFAEGKKALVAGKHIQYVGAIGGIAFDKWQNSAGLFEIVKSNRTQVRTYTASQVDAAK
jgi:ABC-type branched-subunit amino acid transport system substrate-binding protein